jgi:hypothetical protein
MTRRKFLTIAGIGGIALAASLKLLTEPFEKSAIAMITKELKFLKLDRTGLEQFVEAYSQNKDEFYKLRMKSYGLLGVTASQSGRINHLVSTYLLSTDFFIHKTDESRIIKYVSFYNPFIKPCDHPFCHLQYPEGNS